MPFIPEYEESEHPRGPGGQWITKGGKQQVQTLDVKTAAPPAPRKRRLGSVDYNDYNTEAAKGLFPYDEHKLSVDLKLTQRERGALDSYSAGWAYGLNRDLRKGKEAEGVIDLDRVMQRSALTKNIVLYRGYDTTSAFSQALDQLKPGQSVIDQGYLSTSLTQLPPRLYTTEPDKIKSMRIYADKGARAVVTGQDGRYGTNMDEVILDRGSSLVYQGKGDDGVPEFKLKQKGVTVQHAKLSEAKGEGERSSAWEAVQASEQTKSQGLAKFLRWATGQKDEVQTEHLRLEAAQDYVLEDEPLPTQSVMLMSSDHMAGKQELEVLINPTEQDLRYLGRGGKDEEFHARVRVLVDRHGNVFAARGFDATHWDLELAIRHASNEKIHAFPDAYEWWPTRRDPLGIGKAERAVINRGLANAKKAEGATTEHVENTLAAQDATLEKLNIKLGPDISEDKAKEPLEKAGFTVFKVHELSPEMQDALVAQSDIRPPSRITELHALAANGFIKALGDVKGTVINDFNKHINTIPVLFADYDPSDAMMTTVVGNREAAFLINTKCDVAQTLAAPSDQLISVAAKKAAEEYKRSSDYRKALFEQARWSAVHEMVHAVDSAYSDKLTDSMVNALMQEGFKSPRAMERWLSKNISPYALTSPKEACAEAVTKYIIEGKLPGVLGKWADSVVKEHANGKARTDRKAA